MPNILWRCTMHVKINGMVVMPHQITWEKRGIVATFAGHCTIADVRDVFETVGADPRFDQLRYQIFDYLGVTQQNVTQEELDLIVGIDFAHYFSNPDVVYASVSVDPRINGLIDYFISANEHPERLKRCAGVEEARGWIKTVTGLRP